MSSDIIVVNVSNIRVNPSSIYLAVFIVTLRVHNFVDVFFEILLQVQNNGFVK